MLRNQENSWILYSHTVERVIEQGCQYDILNWKFSNVLNDLVSDKSCVCMYLTNFDNPVNPLVAY